MGRLQVKADFDSAIRRFESLPPQFNIRNVALSVSLSQNGAYSKDFDLRTIDERFWTID